MRTLRHTEFKSGLQYVAKSESETKTFGFQSLCCQTLHSALSVCSVWWKKKVNHEEMSKLGYMTNYESPGQPNNSLMGREYRIEDYSSKGDLLMDLTVFCMDCP